jgi:hypothetical protein
MRHAAMRAADGSHGLGLCGRCRVPKPVYDHRHPGAPFYEECQGVIARSDLSAEAIHFFLGTAPWIASLALAMTVSRRATPTAVIARLDRAIQYSKDGCDGISRFRVCARLEGWAAGLALRVDLPQRQIKSGH